MQTSSDTLESVVPSTSASDEAVATVKPGRLPYPSTVVMSDVFWPYLTFIGLFHLLLPLACIPWLFSWTGVLLIPIGNYIFGSLGVNLGYHRLLTHRSLECPKWLEHTFAILGVCSLQDAPARWVAIHRMHHKYSDETPDPHSPQVNFFWGHMGWLFVSNKELESLNLYEKYVRDLMQDKFYVRLERRHYWVWVYIYHAIIILALGMLAGWLTTSTPTEAVQFGLSIFVWGVIVRTVYVWHITWFVNSAAHRWGYQNYETGENSRNNWWVAMLTNGEGWHNNHHADQRSAAHGHRWWELDLTYWTIVLLKKVGLVTEVHDPSPKLVLKSK